MIYGFKCNCGNRTQVNAPMSEAKNLHIVCDKCGKDMTRDFKSSIYVNENDRSDNVSDTSWVKEHMKIRPSGNVRSIY